MGYPFPVQMDDWSPYYLLLACRYDENLGYWIPPEVCPLEFVWIGHFMGFFKIFLVLVGPNNWYVHFAIAAKLGINPYNSKPNSEMSAVLFEKLVLASLSLCPLTLGLQVLFPCLLLYLQPLPQHDCGLPVTV